MEKLLTIGITSYNRINELKRCIESINTKYNDYIEILVSEDNSPMHNEIKQMITSLQKDSKYKIIFETNTVNLGYDANLCEIIKKSQGKFIFFLSDDDIIYKNSLDNIIEFLKYNQNVGVLYGSFIINETEKKCRFRKKSFYIRKEEQQISRYIYDSILFSGLIFRRDYVVSCISRIDLAKFRNINYIQVYLFLTLLYKYGGYYLVDTHVIFMGDGENAFGLSESSGGNKRLANRKEIKSQLEFAKTLIKCIRYFDEDNKTHIFGSFSWQYSLHSYSGLSVARNQGLKYFNEYFKLLISLDIKIYSIVYCYYIILLIFGKKISDKILYIFMLLIKNEE